MIITTTEETTLKLRGGRLLHLTDPASAFTPTHIPLDSFNGGRRMNRFSSHLASRHYLTLCSIMMLSTAMFQCGCVALQQPHKSKTPTVGGLSVYRIPLRQKQQQRRRRVELYPYCFALGSILDLPTKSNILATQVWPSARVAAITLEERILAKDSNFCAFSDDKEETEGRKNFTICELGCGPGLPSLTSAAAVATCNEKVDFRVIATDVDEFALDLVNAAAKEQGLDSIVSTRRIDLVKAGCEEWTRKGNNAWIRDVDLFVMSDVFESNAVAVGAARFTHRVLCWTESNLNEKDDQRRVSRRKRKRVWVFAQTDRSQREVYLRELKRLSSTLSGGAETDNLSQSSLKWKAPGSFDLKDNLWLCDVDETLVDYG